jgi:hypothetical protein
VYALNDPADLVLIGVKGRCDLQVGATSREERQHGTPEVADSDEGDVFLAATVHIATYTLLQAPDVIAVRGAARVADGHEIASDLGGGAAGKGAQLMGVDAFLPLALETRQDGAIEGQATDNDR